MNYGLPYLGSKSKILKDVCAIFPIADNFYDLFGGGFSVTHFMLTHRSKHYKEFHFNEIRTGMPEFIKKCIDGFYSYKNFKPKWIDRETFFKEKENDLYVKLCWSFGNNGDNYLFGKDIENYKKSLHNAIIFNEFDDFAKKTLGITSFKEGYSITDRRLFLRNRILVLGKNRSDLEQLQQLERLQQLQQLQQLERLHFYNTSYEQVPIKNNSVIYCDIPYKGTAEYDDGFNHNKFFEWAVEIKHPLFISEYNVSSPHFVETWNKKVKSSLSGGNSTERTEKLYCNKIAHDILMERRNKLRRK